MRSLVIALATAASFAGIGPVCAMALDMDQLLSVCHATSVAEATKAGERLGWGARRPASP